MSFGWSTDLRDGRIESGCENMVRKNLTRAQKQPQFERCSVVIDECSVGEYESE